MTPPAAAPPVSEVQPNPLASTLGGKEAILARFQAFQKGEAEPVQKEAPQEEVKVESQAPEKVEAKQESSLLPKEKEVIKPVAKEEPKKVEDKKGSDGLTKEERAELIKFKEEASRAKELEAKLKDFDLTTKELNELKALKSELEEKAKVYEAKATAFDVTATPKFQETIAKPMGRLVEAMERLCAGNEISVDEVFAALENPDISKGNATLAEFMASLNTFDQGDFTRMVGDMRDLNRKGQELVAKAPEAWTALQAEQQKAQEVEKTKAKETYKMANEAVFKAMQDRFPFLKEETLAKDVSQGALEVDFDNLSPDAKAYYAQAGMVALHFNPIIKSKDEEIASLKAALKKHSITVGPASGSKPDDKGESQKQESETEGSTVGSRLVAAMAGVRG